LLDSLLQEKFINIFVIMILVDCQYSILISLVLTYCVKSTAAKEDMECEDDAYKDCESRAADGACEGSNRAGADSYGYAKWMLAHCRKSCREKYQNESTLPSIISDYGGLDDSVEDVFGFDTPFCSHNGGFTVDGRMTLLDLHAMNSLQPEWVPKFTKVGFEKTKIPADIYKRIMLEYKQLKDDGQMIEEPCSKAVINCEVIVDKDDICTLRSSRRTFVTALSQSTLDALKETLHPLAEEWAGANLQHTFTYGIRRYTNDSWLVSHVDRFNTHVISAILNIDQKVDDDWSLYIKDNDGESHAVVLEAGDMVWYESARAVHGRPDNFKGEYFDNLFIHYKPTGDWYEEPFQIGVKPRSIPLKAEDYQN